MLSFRVRPGMFFLVVIAAAALSLAVLMYGTQRQKVIAASPKSIHTSQVVNFLEERTKSWHFENLGLDEDEDTTEPTSDTGTPTKSSGSSKRRRSLLIFGADRSGTTFISRMFSEDPNVFMIYEPLWVTKRWRKVQPSEEWSRSEVEVLNGILSCNFADFPMATKFLAHTSKNWAAAPFKNPFETANFCNISETGVKLCQNFSLVPKFAGDSCASKYKHSVTKVAQVRAHGRNLSTIVPQVFLENLDTDIKVIQILRDPRGSLDSRIKLGWMPRHTAPSFAHSVQSACQKTAENVKYGRSLETKYPGRYMEVYYRDIARFPVKTALRIYSFAEFDMPEELLKWIVFNTSPSEEALAREAKKTFSPVRNSTANVEKWRSAPEEQNHIIERECSELMKLIGIEE